MNGLLHVGLVWWGTALTASAMAYAVAAAAAARLPQRGSKGDRHGAPQVTVMKPLCGIETQTYHCLRSFCDQDYPEFQVVFGVRDPTDPVIELVHRLRKEFPQRDIALAIDCRQHGSNPKVSNLVNMMPFARHGLLVVADSDVLVERDYLRRIVPPLLDDNVGIVTCAYTGYPGSGPGSCLEALFINEWFIPSVRVAALCGSRSFAFGATIGIARQTLGRIGGFTAIADQLADDYRLGELTRRLGLRTVLSDVIVGTCIAERNLRELLRHELRWLRTIRAIQPWGYGLAFVTFGVPVGALGSLLAAGSRASVAMLAITAICRFLVHFSARARSADDSRAGNSVALLPLRDLLGLGLWAWSFVTRRVQWRDEHFQVTRDGSVLRIVRI